MAINADNDGRTRIREFVQENQLEQRMLIRGDGVGFQQYNLKRLPTVYFVDRKGNVVGREAGYQSYEQLEKSLQKALK